MSGASVAGVISGAAGAVVGLAAVPFTFGLSLPVSATVAAGIGIAAGAVEGGAYGEAIGTVAGQAFRRRSQVDRRIDNSEDHHHSIHDNSVRVVVSGLTENSHLNGQEGHIVSGTPVHKHGE